MTLAKSLELSWALLSLAALTACDTSWAGDLIGRPVMTGPVNAPTVIPGQDTPELEARAAEEREDLPHPPPPREAGFPPLGAVPPKPVMPTPAEIAAATADLQTEQQAGAAAIAAQAGAIPPETLPKPNANGTPPAAPVAPLPVISTPIAPYLSGEAGLEGVESQMFSGDNQALLPQSQVIEQSDLHPEAR